MITDNDTFRSYPSKIEEIYNNWPKVEDEGNNISLTPVRKGKMILELTGNTTQNGTPTPDAPVEVKNATGGQVVKVAGKNLWNENTQVFTNQSRFNNPTKDSNNMWTFTIGGSNGYAFATSKITLQAGTYTASAIVDNGDFIILKGSVTQPNTFTLTEDTEITFRVYKNGNIGDVVKLSNVMIEKGSTATEYEAYKEQSYEINLGKNLFDKSNITTGKTYTGTGDITTLDNSFVQETYIPVSSSTAYTMSTTNDYSSETDYRLVICEYKDDKTFIKRNLGGRAVGNKYTITTTENTKYVRLCASTITLDELQFEKGSQATSYAPYFTPIELCKIGDYQDSIRKGTGKNLFDKTKVTNGYYVNSTTGNLSLGTTDFNASDFIPVSNGDYVWGATSTTGYHLVVYDNNKNFIRAVGRSIKQAIKITIGNDEKYVRYTVSTADLNTQQFEKGSQATSYEPYGYKGKWYLEKKIGKVVLDGNEWWNKGTTQVSDNSYYYTATYDSLIGWNTYLMYCNYFEQATTFLTPSYNSNGSVISGPNPSSTSNNRLRILIPNSTGATTTTNFKNWIIANTPVVYYVLTTPTVEEITDSTLVNDLNNLEDAKSYNNITNIIIIRETPINIKASALMKGGN